jgi:SRSO17 transposase
MKTPIQELIDEMQKSPLMFASALTLVEKMKMLEKERWVIMDSFSSGEHQQGFEGEAEQYYDETFNTKEK